MTSLIFVAAPTAPPSAVTLAIIDRGSAIEYHCKVRAIGAAWCSGYEEVAPKYCAQQPGEGDFTEYYPSHKFEEGFLGLSSVLY